MRPPANRRKNDQSVLRTWFLDHGFNEAACEQAEEPGLPLAAGPRLGCCFNEAACEQAEELLVDELSYRPLEASMRPPANRRKNLKASVRPSGEQRRFNEAACEQAEEHGLTGSSADSPLLLQ